MKVITPNQIQTQKPNKPTEIIFRTNRSYDKLALNCISKATPNTPSKQPSIPFLLNSLHSCLVQDKQLPKNCLKRVIEILSHLQNKNISQENHRFVCEKTPEQIIYGAKRQFTEDANDFALNVQRSTQRRETTRIRKIRTKKFLQNSTPDLKQNQGLQFTQSLQKKIAEELAQIFQKKIAELEQNIEGLKKALQLKQSEIKGKQSLIAKLGQQKQLYEKSLADLLKQNQENQRTLKAEIQHLSQYLVEANESYKVLKSQLFQRQAEILSYWSVKFKQM